MDPETTVPEVRNNRRYIVLIALALVLALIIIGIAYAAYVRFMMPGGIVGISTYQECVQASGSQLPDELTCITAEGQTFTLTPSYVPPVVEQPPITTRELVQTCPQQWVIEMETAPAPSGFIDGEGNAVSGSSSYTQKDEYFMINGQRLSRAEVDVDWVGQNCDISPTSQLP